MFVAPLHMLQMYDRVLVSRSEVTLIVLTLLAVGLLMIYGILEGVRSRILSKVGLEFDELISSRILNMVFEIAVSRPSVRSPQQLIRDADFIRDFIGGPAIIALCDAPWVPVFIAACFVLHPLLGFIALVGAILVFLLAASNEFLTREKLSEANRLWLKAANDSLVSLRNSEIIKALGMIGGIIASGTYTFALWNKLNLEVNGDIAWIAGMGFEDFRFPKPLRPGVKFRSKSRLIDKRISQKDPSRGVVRHEYQVISESGEIFFVCVCPSLVHVNDGD